MSADPGAKRRLWVPGAGAGPVPDGWAAAASAGLCVPGRGQRREEQRRCGAASGGCPGDPQGSGARGAAAFGGSAGWEPAVAWSRAPCALGCPSACDPFWCWGSWARLATAVPRGRPSEWPRGWCPQPKRGPGAFPSSFPQGRLLRGRRGEPQVPWGQEGLRAGLALAGLHGARERLAGRPRHRPTRCGEGQCRHGAVLAAAVATPAESPLVLVAGQRARWLGTTVPGAGCRGRRFGEVEVPHLHSHGVAGGARTRWAAGRRGARGQRGSPGAAEPAAAAAGHAVGLLGDPSCRARGSQQAPAKGWEQDGHGDDGRTDGQGCGWRLRGQTAASSWLLGF